MHNHMCMTFLLFHHCLCLCCCHCYFHYCHCHLIVIIAISSLSLPSHCCYCCVIVVLTVALLKSSFCCQFVIVIFIVSLLLYPLSLSSPSLALLPCHGWLLPLQHDYQGGFTMELWMLVVSCTDLAHMGCQLSGGYCGENDGVSFCGDRKLTSLAMHN